MCKCPIERTDGLPPCGKSIGHKRPDGWYCDCGHEVTCCRNGTVDLDLNKK